MNEPMYWSSRSFLAAEGGATWNAASRVLTDARWWATGQTPQIRVVMMGMSSAGRPTQNASKPRSSGTFRYAFSTSPSSLRKMDTLPWPSSLVIGSMLISFIASSPSVE